MSLRVAMFGIEIDALCMSDAVAMALSWVSHGSGHGCRYVVTPNVDHVVRLNEDAAFRAAYADASMVLADGAPVVAASRLLGCPLPERVAGSDFVPALLDAARERGGLSVFLLGGEATVTQQAARRIAVRWPHVTVVGTSSPPHGFENDAGQNEAIVSQIREARPDLLVICFGAPKQELWVHAHRARLPATVAVCAGATIDFLAARKARAPLWMRQCGLEWLHRLGCEPRRLLARYARDAWVFPRLLWGEIRLRRSACTRTR